MRLSLLLLVVTTVAAAPVAADRDKTLERCISLDRKIERYTRLRRGGGSAAQMDRWRDARQVAKEEFQALRCHKFGRKLRRRG